MLIMMKYISSHTTNKTDEYPSNDPLPILNIGFALQTDFK